MQRSLPQLGAFVVLFLQGFSSLALQAPEQKQPLDLSEREAGLSETQILEELRKNPRQPEAYIKLGALVAKQGQLDLSRSYLLRALELDPKNAEAHEQLGINYGKREDWNTALLEMKKAAQLQPRNPGYHFNLGATYYNSRSYPEALDEFRVASQLQFANPDFHFALASTLEAEKRLAEAQVEYSRIIAGHPRFARAHYALADVLFKQGEIEKAAKYVRMAVELKPDYAAAYYLQGKIQETKREFAAAAHSYARAIELEPGHINAHYQLGLLYPRLGQPEEGRRQTAIFQSLKSRVDAINAVILGTNFLRAGKYRLAEENFARAVASDPHDPQALYYLGAAQQMEGESAKAIDSYRKSLAANSRVAIVHAELGLLLAQLGHADDALPHLKQALELKKDDFAVALAVGRGFLLLEHYSEAEGPLLRAFRLWPSEPTVVVNLFQMYARWGKNDQAAHYATLAIKAHPEDAHLYYLAALSWAAQQNFAQAIENLRRAVRLSPDFAAAYLKLAWVYYETQQAPLALDAVDRHLRLEPRSGEGHFLKARLQLEKGNLPEALQEARLASQFSSRDPEVFLLLSQVCRRLDRIEEGEAAWQHYRQLDSSTSSKGSP